MKQKYVIAYDVGTSGVKAVLVNMRGEIIVTATVSYPLYVEHEGWAEQDPELYWDSVCKVTHKAPKTCGPDSAEAEGLVFATQWRAIIPVGAGGRTLHNSIIWLDGRADEEARRLNEHLGKNNLLCGADYWPKLMWFREKLPEIYKETELIFEVNSFLKWKATGEAAMDLSNSFVRSFDPELQNKYDDILLFADIDKGKFPRLVNGCDLVGHITPTAAQEMGLKTGIPVFGGGTDISAMAIGSGTSAVGKVHIYFGSSGWICCSRPHTADDMYVCPLDPDCDIGVIAAMSSIGLSFNWALNRLYPVECAKLGDGIYDYIEEELKQIPPGSENLFALPWFYGGRPPLGTNYRGVFYNLGDQHDRRHIMRAVMEGVCYTLKWRSSLNKEPFYVIPEEVVAVGGGSLNPIWMQMLADVMDISVKVPRASMHIGALGVACCALIGLGVYKDFAEVSDKLVIERRYEPNPVAVEKYKEAFVRFERLLNSVKLLFESGI